MIAVLFEGTIIIGAFLLIVATFAGAIKKALK